MRQCFKEVMVFGDCKVKWIFKLFHYAAAKIVGTIKDKFKKEKKKQSIKLEIVQASYAQKLLNEVSELFKAKDFD